MPPREFYFNPEFDLSLRRPQAPRGQSPPEIGESAYFQEMAMHFLFVGEPGDSFVLHRPLPQDFLDYLHGKNIALPRIVIHPTLTPQAVFTPFGWNELAESRARLYHVAQPHPPLESIKRANARTFSLALENAVREDEKSEEAFAIGAFDSMGALEEFLGNLPVTPGCVVKGNHGNAGTANRRIPGGPLSDEDRKGLAKLLEDNGIVVVEPWHERILDMSVNFFLEPDGNLRDFRGHELLNSRDGAFLGVKIHASRKPPEPWSDALEANAHGLARALHAIGYFGPVSVDAYVRNSPMGPKLRALVDVNARHSMAFPAHALARRLPGKTLLWFWTKPRKLRLPETYAELEARLGRWAFDAETQSGILATSPLSVLSEAEGESRARPKRIGFLFSADGEDHLASMGQAFAAALGRR